MKFHALTLCLAGSLFAVGAAAEDKTHSRMHSDTAVAGERVDHSSWPFAKPFKVHNQWTKNTYTQQYPFYKEGSVAYGPVAKIVPDRIAFYLDLPPLSEVAAKIQEIHHHNAMEAAELRSLANRARALGWTNIAAVYDQIASDHSKGATFAANWLTDNNFPAPAMPSTVTVADTMSEADIRNSVDRILDMHIKAYDETLTKLHNEKSSTVRGMYLMNLVTISRHIDWLEMLNSDVDRNRRDLSARLASELDATRTTRTAREWETMIFEEEWALYSTTTGPAIAQTPYVVPPDAEIVVVEKPVYIERIVTAPAPQPTFTATETRSVETVPVIAAPPAAVAGQREVRTRRPARRPAK